MAERKQRLDERPSPDQRNSEQRSKEQTQTQIEDRPLQGSDAGERAAEAQTDEGLGSSSEDNAQPTRDDIARHAYERFHQRGGEHGRDVHDWLEAEQALRQQKRWEKSL